MVWIIRNGLLKNPRGFALRRKESRGLSLKLLFVLKLKT
jgi:hypothetical protein